MNPDVEELPPPLWLRVAILAITVVVGVALSEALVRWKSENAVPHVEIFELRDGLLRLQADQTLRLMRPDGGNWTLNTDARGFRQPEATLDKPWLVVGDSQVLGLGVEDEESFPARIGAINGGVPGYSLDDALAMADAFASRIGGVVVVVNQANDWEEVGRDALDRYQICGGRLVLLDSPPWRCSWLGSPLTRLRLLHFASLALLPKLPPPEWAAPHPAITAELAAAVRVFREEHPSLAVLSVFLPVDYATSEQRSTESPWAGRFEGRPWEEPSLNEGLELDVDLLPALTDPACFQARDYHLSPHGHEVVAKEIRAALDSGFP